MIEESYSGIARSRRKRLRERTLGEVLSGRLRNLVVALCFLAVFVACFQESIRAMSILSLPQKYF